MEQQEQSEWNDVNNLLQNHGFRPVCFADPVENKNLSDLVLLDKKSAVDMRTTLKTMLSDSDRRQALIQELIMSNNQLKGEVSRAAAQSQRVEELERLLDVVTAKVQELEERFLADAVHHHAQTRQLQQEKQDAHKLCQSLEQKLAEQREEVIQLHRKLHFTVKEEERRRARQTRAVLNVCKTDAAAADPQLLDVIDFYETQMVQLQDELRLFRGEAEGSGVSEEDRVKKSGNVTPSFTSVLKVLRDELKESRAERDELRREVERLKRDVETRPKLKELKFYKDKTHRLETSNKQRNSRSLQENKAVRGNVCERATESSPCFHYYQVLCGLSSIMEDPQTPFHLLAHTRGEFDALVPTLQLWAQQLHLLKELQRGLNKLMVRLMPWQPSDHGSSTADAVKVEDMMLQVDIMLENTAAADEEKMLRSPSRHTLESMVSHFQKLFDVASLSGVYPRMNEVYTRLGHMTNAVRNLRDVLELDDRAPLSEVVNKVARLTSSSSRDAVPPQLHGLLGDADIDTIVVRVKQHEEFFPAFHALVMEMLQILGVGGMEDILPALRALKQQQAD